MAEILGASQATTGRDGGSGLAGSPVGAWLGAALVGTDQIVDYMMISDGLVDVSIYLAAAEAPMGDELVRQGATSLLRMLNDHKVEVTVVGEVPVSTAQRIAESLHPLAKGSGHD